MGEPVTYFEVLSPDPHRAQQFYAELFGWTLTPAPVLGEGYALVGAQDGGAIGGGIGAATDAERGVKVYARVDDIEAFLAKAESLGATRVAAATDLPSGYGRFAVFADPDGALFGLWQTD